MEFLGMQLFLVIFLNDSNILEIFFEGSFGRFQDLKKKKKNTLEGLPWWHSG